jgi:SAM-dependent methyltransferase
MEAIEVLLKERGGIRLDIGCGVNKNQGFVGMDIQPLEGVDIIWDWNKRPWPLPDECVLMAVASHVVEHIPPVSIVGDETKFPFVEFMDEVWRVLKVGGEFALVCPHGNSQGYLQDPTHVNSLNETTWVYFDPEHPTGFYRFYKPKPWKIKFLSWDPSANIEVVLVKRGADDQA